ncbi:MAG: hypothetical protein AAF226_18535 [Verrucomicrobiota bacterium]
MDLALLHYERRDLAPATLYSDLSSQYWETFRQLPEFTERDQIWIDQTRDLQKKLSGANQRASSEKNNREDGIR